MTTLPLLGSGRDCDVFDLGDGTVLRRRRDGLVLPHEAAAMRHARRHGYPCPEVVAEQGADLVLERVDGPTMLEALIADPSPEAVVGAGRVLAGLHERLHDVPPTAGGDGCLVHLDLHPGNVVLSPSGPVVIDWTNARDGTAGVDLAMTWVILGAVPEACRLLAAYLDAIDRAAAEAGLDEATVLRRADPNLDDDERARIRP